MKQAATVTTMQCLIHHVFSFFFSWPVGLQQLNWKQSTLSTKWELAQMNILMYRLHHQKQTCIYL